jgi:hypothetical protein
MSLELEIGELKLTFEGATGQQHRVPGISHRAIAILEEVVNQNLQQLELAAGGRRLAVVTTQPVQMDLSRSGDEQVARLVAQAIYGALIEQLRV